MVILIGGCAKEYSNEGGPEQDSTMPGDIIVRQDSASITLSDCKGCNSTDTSSGFRWSFKAGITFLCGTVTKAVLSPDSNGMTFFGPSACSLHSGLIITAFFSNQTLNKDQSGIAADRASLEYYDNTTNSDVLQSKQPNIFSLTIDSYIRQTGISTGTFSGSVLYKNGKIIKVDSGRFRIKF